ncbi:MAG: glutaredoxin family protein [Polyangia bacterium]|jgi:glutaredoxin
MRFHRQGFQAHVILTLLLLLGACKKGTPPAPPPTAQAELPPFEVSKDSALLFIHVEPNGNFATTDKADSVPEVARRLVRVIDPAKGAAERRDTSSVYVVDLRELLGNGKARARTMSREAFETGALAQLPPGDSSALAGPHGPALPEEPEQAASDAGIAGQGGPPVVILYGTPWCGACKAARQYLSSKHIPFAYKDIENDQSAARELQQKASRLGIPADRVPILDVRGRLLVGFDRTRLEALLGDAT